MSRAAAAVRTTVQTESPERYHPRVRADLQVKVLINGRAYAAQARDLSMAGLFLGARVPAGADVLDVAIPLPGDREIVTRCHVRRRMPDGAGLEFDGLDWDDLFALARYLHPRLP